MQKEEWKKEEPYNVNSTATPVYMAVCSAGTAFYYGSSYY
jgi:hypothetical protein